VQLVNRAIYNTEDALLQGAFRVHQKQILRQFTTKDGKKVSNWKVDSLTMYRYG
jgi:hypothetical protein